MSKRVIIVHGWGSRPNSGWFVWLKKELEKRGFEVFCPFLPKPDEPRIKNWIPALEMIVGKPDEQTYFVGHSMGCQTIARYLATLPEGVKVGGVVFVGGFFRRLMNLDVDEQERSITNEWLNTPLDLLAVKKHMKKSVAIFSDNDRYVPIENQEDFRDFLGSKIVVEHGKGHFYQGGEMKELPSALKAIMEIAK